MFNLLRVNGCEHCRFEINYLPALICNVIPERIANRFATRPFIHNVANGVMNLGYRIRAAKNEKKNTRALSIDRASEIASDVFLNQLLRRSVSRLRFGDNCLSVAVYQFRARRKDSPGQNMQSRSR